MFSSTTSYDSNPFPNFPSSSYPTLPFYIDPSEINDFAAATNSNNTTLLLHDPLVVAPFIPTHHDAPSSFPEDITTLANLAVADCTTVAMLDQDNSIVNGNGNAAYGGLCCGVPNLVCTQKPVVAATIAKKDRHSKIHTSQGLRDRRVRLSSEIARKFFDLQDMLEFDKPSNTLEWLFTKSENAIKELARSKHSCSSCNNPSAAAAGDKCSCVDPCDQPHQQLQGGVVVHSGEKSSLVGDSSSSKGRNKLKWTQRDQDVCVQTKKESRDKARARARERTCYKMNNNNNGRVQDLEEIMSPVITASNNAHVLQQLRSSLQMVQQPYPHHHHHLLGDNGGFNNNNVIEESIMMIKRNNVKASNLMSSCSDQHDEQNLVIPNEYYYASFPYSTTGPNWDTNETINGCSNNLRGIATMNISTCFMNQW